MKENPSTLKLLCLRMAFIVIFLQIFGIAFSQTSTWNGSSWDNGAPSLSTGSFTFYVDGPGCVIGDANMSSLYVRYDFTDCNITGTITSTNVIVEYDTDPVNRPSLSIDGTLNVINLTIAGKLTGAGTVNLSAGSFSQTDGTHFGIFNPLTTFNLLSGNVTFSMYFSVVNLTISSGASAIISNYSYNYGPNITNLTVNGNLTNNYAYNDVMVGPIFLTVSNLTINSSGNFNGSSGQASITQTFNVGGTISPAGSIYSYKYNFNNSSTTNVLEVFGNAKVKFTDLAYTTSTYKYISTLKVYGGGSFTIDKNLTLKTLTIDNDGNVITSGTPTLTVNTSIDPIAGRLILPGATLTYSPTTLTLNGTNSALAYLNKSNYSVTLSGATDTIRNCTFQRVTINSGANGYIINGSAYKIQRIDASDQVTIASLPKNDSIQISATGNVIVTGATRVGHLVDIATGGSLTSNGNLTMLDQSNLYFTTDGQIVGDINWHRKYGSLGWVYFSSPFTGLNRTSILGTIAPGYVNFNNYVEGTNTKRWVALANSEEFIPGKGYELGITTIIPADNDTVVFTGNPRRQDITVSNLTYTTTNGTWFDYQRGYNLVGNPYTAPISVDGFFSDNPNLNAIYYWDDIGKGKGVFVARSSSGLITPLASVSDKNKLKVQASYLAPNQGFFVKIPSDGLTTTAVFNESRITRNTNDNFLKSVVANYIRLQFDNASGSKNDCIIQFDMAGNDTYTPNLDVFKLTSTTYPLEVYSFKGTEEFAIQTRKPISDDLHIPIGIIIKNNEKHTFHIDNFDALPLRINAYLWDKVAQRSVNLRDSSFTVALSAGTIDNRFELVLKSGLFASVINTAKTSGLSNEIFAYTQDDHIFINFSQSAQDITVEVTDMSGGIVNYQIIPEAQGNVELKGNYIPNNIYIIKILGKNITKINKLVIR